ncbi:MAG: thermonuclease family protein [Candidatus Latescibacterota bacterium]|nr:MAG: thermonuclease family protein [Candidatus Latescibacterota bacterium]
MRFFLRPSKYVEPKMTISISKWIITRPAVFCLSMIACLSCTSKQPTWYQPSYRGAKLVYLTDIEFDDGDTFNIKGKPIRVLGVDTPEIAHPDLDIFENQPYGVAASESTRAWLTRAKIIEVVRGGKDRYDRRLAHVFIDGELLSCRLIRHGLAYETVSHYGDSGFPDLAQEILDIWRTSERPKFEPPYRWKNRQRKKRQR